MGRARHVPRRQVELGFARSNVWLTDTAGVVYEGRAAMEEGVATRPVADLDTYVEEIRRFTARDSS